MSRMSDNYSNIKMFFHTERIQKLIDGQRCAPIYIRIKPTNCCNQRCYYCFYDETNFANVYSSKSVSRQDEIPFEKMKEIISDISDMGVKAVTFTGGGEPLVYPHITECVHMLRQEGIDYALITNAQALNDEKADAFSDAKWVRVSIESAKETTYSRIRGVNTFHNVIRNIEHFADVKNAKTVLGANCVVGEENYKEIYDLCRILKSAGVENIKLSPVNIGLDTVERQKDIREHVSNLIAEAMEKLCDGKFFIIDKYTGDLSLREQYCKPYEKCYIRNLFTVIAANQKVYGCIDKAYIENGCLGDISHQSFKEMWYSEETARKLRDYDIKKYCGFRCIYEDRNTFLADVLEVDRNHVNFI